MAQWLDSRRRWFGLLFLLLAGGMLVWGQTLLRPHLAGLGFVVYWVVCLVLTVMALITALLDARATRERIRDEHRKMFQNTFRGTPGDRDAGPGEDADDSRS